MNRFSPTPGQRRRYSDYDTEVRESSGNRVVYRDINGVLHRFHVAIARIPSTKRFVIYNLIGCTEEERAYAQFLARTLPHGEWARFPDYWFKRRRVTGPGYKFTQQRGERVADPFVQLELEMLIDLEQAAGITTEVNA